MFLPVSPVTDSNRAPFPYEGNALPNELTGRGACRHTKGDKPPARGRPNECTGTPARARVHACPMGSEDGTAEDGRLAWDRGWARWALQRWESFPADRQPRPLVLTGPPSRFERGFRSGEAKLAFLYGDIQAADSTEYRATRVAGHGRLCQDGDRPARSPAGSPRRGGSRCLPGNGRPRNPRPPGRGTSISAEGPTMIPNEHTVRVEVLTRARAADAASSSASTGIQG